MLLTDGADFVRRENAKVSTDCFVPPDLRCFASERDVALRASVHRHIGNQFYGFRAGAVDERIAYQLGFESIGSAHLA